MKRGKSEVETCVLNNWSVGTKLRGYEQWSAGKGVWTTIRITAMGESKILARCIHHKRIDADGEVLSDLACSDSEKLWTLNLREWTDQLDAEPVRAADPTAGA